MTIHGLVPAIVMVMALGTGVRDWRPTPSARWFSYDEQRYERGESEGLCYDNDGDGFWSCEDQLREEIPNFLGINNVVFCRWGSICPWITNVRDDGRGCSGCDGICLSAQVPHRFVPFGEEGHVYFLAYYEDMTWSAFGTLDMRHSDFRRMQNSAEPCIDPETGQQHQGHFKRRFLALPGKGEVLEPDWDLMDYAGFGDDPLWRWLSGVHERLGPCDAGSPEGLFRRRVLAALGLAHILNLGAPPAGPEDSRLRSNPAQMSNFSVEEWCAIAMACDYLLTHVFGLGEAPDHSGAPGSDGPYPPGFTDRWTQIQRETCHEVQDCLAVPVLPITWGRLKSRY